MTRSEASTITLVGSAAEGDVERESCDERCRVENGYHSKVFPHA